MTSMCGQDEEEGRQRGTHHDERLAASKAAPGSVAPAPDQRLDDNTLDRLGAREIADQEVVVGQSPEIEAQDRGIEPVVDPAADPPEAIERSLPEAISIRHAGPLSSVTTLCHCAAVCIGTSTEPMGVAFAH